jgi:hypothetical protein
MAAYMAVRFVADFAEETRCPATLQTDIMTATA